MNVRKIFAHLHLIGGLVSVEFLSLPLPLLAVTGPLIWRGRMRRRKAVR